MKNKKRNLTLIGVAGGIAMALITRAVIKKYRAKSAPAAEGFTGAPPNRLFAAYRGKFRPHRRQAGTNGIH